jgi:hypothetical protein
MYLLIFGLFNKAINSQDSIASNVNIVMCRGVCVAYRRVLDLLTPYAHNSGLQAIISDLHTLHFTVAHALGFSVFISRILATDL